MESLPIMAPHRVALHQQQDVLDKGKDQKVKSPEGEELTHKHMYTSTRAAAAFRRREVATHHPRRMRYKAAYAPSPVLSGSMGPGGGERYEGDLLPERSSQCST